MEIKTFAAMACAAALCICGTTACSDDDENETTDVREQAIGEYTSSTTIYLENDGLLYDFSSYMPKEDLGTSTVTKSGDNGIGLDVDGDKITISKIKAANNGFVGDIEDNFSFDGYKVTGFKGADLTATGSTTEKYDAMYLTASKTLSIYLSASYNEMVNDDEAAAIAANALGVTTDEFDSSSVNVVILITSVKK